MHAGDQAFTIGKLSGQTDVGIETIRYYEKIGLLPSPPRSEGGHRLYNKQHVARLVLLRRSRKLGFSIEEIRTLVGLVEEGVKIRYSLSSGNLRLEQRTPPAT